MTPAKILRNGLAIVFVALAFIAGVTAIAGAAQTYFPTSTNCTTPKG